MRKKKRLTGILSVLFVFVIVIGVFAACDMGNDPPVTIGSRQDDDEKSGWTKSWEGYSIDNLPPASYWNQVGENWYWPNLFEKIDGTAVITKEDWVTRYEELKIILQHYLYGYLPPKPTGQTFSYTPGSNPNASGTIRVEMTYGENNASMSGTITYPTNNASSFTAPWPLDFGGTVNMDGPRGYAIMSMPNGDAAVRTLFNYSTTDPDAPGDLIVTAWAAGRIIDAIEYLTQEGQALNGLVRTDAFTITGHSRGGKDALVAAAFEPRIGVSAPSSSGALGAAPERFIKTVVKPSNNIHAGNPAGKGFYYMDAPRGNDTNPANHVMQYLIPGVPPPHFIREYGPIQSIQGYDHARTDSTAGGSSANGQKSTWVSYRAMQFSRFNEEIFWTTENGYDGKGSMAQAPFDQHFLAALMAGPDPDKPRGLLMSAGNDGDSWVHPEGTYINFLVTREIYKFLGKPDYIAAMMDNSGGHVHTTLRRRMQLDLCDYLFRNVPLPIPFMELDKDGSFYGPGAEYPLDIRSLEDYKLINWAAPGEKSLAEIAEEYFKTHTTYADIGYF